MRSDRILVVYSGWLGDLVWILPMLHALRAGFESVSLVASHIQAPLARLLTNGLIDNVFLDRSSERWTIARRTRNAARAQDIGVFLDVKGRGKNGLFIPWRRGARVLLPHRHDAREALLARLLHPRAESLPRRPEGHMVEAYLSSLRAFDIPHSLVSFKVPFDQATIDEGEKLAADAGLRERPSVALNIGSAQFSKIWPASHFKRLAEILSRELGCSVFILGAQSFEPNRNYDRETARTVFGRSENWISWVEKTSFAVDAYLLQSGAFSLAIGNDSYAGHIAGSAEEVEPDTPGAARAENGYWYRAHPTLSLFGPTNPLFCRPYDPTGVFNTVLMPERYPEDCVYNRDDHICPHYGDRHCRGDSHCMQHLSPERVASAAGSILLSRSEHGTKEKKGFGLG